MIIVNCMPIYPLDGYRISLYFLNKIFDELYSYDLMFYLSILLEIIIIIFLYFFRLYPFIFIMIFLLIKTIRNRKEERQKINLNTIYNLLK